MSQSVSENVVAGRYRLVEPIGLGGMAEVHRAWDTLLRRHVAVKLFQPGFDPEAARRFDNEVRVLAGLSHPGLVSVYDADTGADAPFVVLRLVEGETVRERIARGPQPLDQVRRLGARLADALAHVHSHGLVHRDVKPSNILLDHEDNPYLADFGLVHLTGATRLTRTDQLVGTAAYLAPEQVLGQDVDDRADVYALGLVLLECLTGRREYGGGEVEAAIARLHRPPVLPEHLPTDVEQLLSRMTSTSAGERPAAHDCAEVLGAEIPGTEIPVVLPVGGTVPMTTDTTADSAADGAIDGTVAAAVGATANASTGAAASAPVDVPVDAEASAQADDAADTAAALAAGPAASAAAAPAAGTATNTAAADTMADTVPNTVAYAPKGAPRRERRMPRKTLLASAGVLLGAVAITTAATSVQDPATSSPASSTAPAAPQQQQHSSAPPVQPGAPQQVVDHRQVAVTTQVTGAPQPTTTSQGTPLPTTTPATTPPPVTGTSAELTSEPPAATTTPQQTSATVVPTTDDSGSNTGTGEPTAPSQGD
ncbi:serine/threonine-protein kinase [Saccharothrix xinjiangensis]|uniref:Protein kinase n=1 Tax=Saccharothrix xinjiangensis TaxID=204798 RepID=A0ABV9XXS8_9PSEU